MASRKAQLAAAYETRKTRPKEELPKPNPPKGRSRIPRSPNAAELAYLKANRSLMRAIGRAAQPEIVALTDLLGKREDAADGSGPARSVLLRRLRDKVRQVVRNHIEAGIVSGIAQTVNEGNLREMQRVLGIDRRALLPDAPLDDWTRENVSLITSIGEEYLGQVEQVVTEAADAGLRHEVLAAQLQERLGVAESRANLIARDQVLKANADLAHARMRRVGVTRYIWRATPDSRTRPDHKALDGQTFAFDDPPIIDQRTGERGNPGEGIQCRCQAEPIFDDEP